MLAILSTFAQAAPAPDTSPDLADYLLQFGLPGMVILALLSGQLWTAKSYKEQKDLVLYERARADKAEEKRDEMVQVYNEKFLPLMTALVPLLTDVRDRLAEQQAEEDRVFAPPRRRAPSGRRPPTPS